MRVNIQKTSSIITFKIFRGQHKNTRNSFKQLQQTRQFLFYNYFN